MWRRVLPALLLLLCAAATADPSAADRKRKKKEQEAGDAYAAYVWPAPPDEPRIRLEAVISGRADVEGKGSKWKKRMIGASPQALYDSLQKPMAVAFAPDGKILVTDYETHALIRFDLEEARMDVFGTRTALPLSEPMGLTTAADGTIYVADVALAKIVAFDAEGGLLGAYGATGELAGPTDVALSPDGDHLFVTDAKAHRIVVFDRAARSLERSFGARGDGDGEFSFPTSLAFGPQGDLYVVDQLNARVQVFLATGDYVDQFGARGTGFGNFVRPKGIAVDEVGFIYVADFAFNNIQLFDSDFSLLTFIGAGGSGPGRFQGASDIAVQGQRIAVVDQLGGKLQLFRFLRPKSED